MKRILAISLGLLMAIGLFAQEQDPDLQYATELLKPGTAAPDFTLTDINGHSVSLRDFQGRKVVLVFWASWCPDCRAEVPALKELQAKSDPRKVAFVAVSFDRTKDAWEKYVKENEMTGVQLFENAPRKESFVNDAYHVKWIPSLYLIDEKGKVALSTVVLDKVVKALNKSEYAQETNPSGSRAGGRFHRVPGGKHPFCLPSVPFPGRQADLFQL